MCAKHYENPTMLSEVTAKNVGDVFLRHTAGNGLELELNGNTDVWKYGNGNEVLDWERVGMG